MNEKLELTSQEQMILDRIGQLFPKASSSPKKRRVLANALSVFHLEDGESVRERKELSEQVFIVITGALMKVGKKFDPTDEPDGHNFKMIHAKEAGSLKKKKEDLIAVGQSYVLSVTPNFFKNKLKGRKKLISKLVKSLNHPELIAGEYDRRGTENARRKVESERLEGVPEEQRKVSDRRFEEEEDDNTSDD